MSLRGDARSPHRHRRRALAEMTSRRHLLQLGGAAGAALASACGVQGQAPAAPAKLPSVVVWASNTGQADLPYFERFAKWFEEANPGTKVDLVLPPGEGTYEAKMIAMFAGGTYPDVFHLHFTRIREFWAKNLLAPLDQYIKTARTPVDDFIPGVMVPFKIRGQTWGLPRDNATGVMYYNKELFAASGVKEPDADWQWDTTFLEGARRLTDLNKKQFGIVFPSITGIGDQHLEIYRTWGADWYDADMKEARINSPAAIEAMQFMADLRLRHHVAPQPNETPSGDQFQNGWAAMTNQWQGYVRGIKLSNATFQWDVTPLFKGPRGAKAVNVVGSTGHSVPRGAKNPEAGYTLTTHLVDEQVQRDMMSQGRWTTPRRSFLKHALPTDGVPARYQEAIIDRLLQVQGYATAVAHAELNTVWQTETAPVWEGARPVKDALDAVKVQWDRLLREYPSA
ncbi:MAG TPA: sugar ABC transporter substrate-binding protein [Chloroflexota bacterium]|nr:sugar ABC transporter substrate-binding protein [Chloroflexota bacterium]